MYTETFGVFDSSVCGESVRVLVFWTCEGEISSSFKSVRLSDFTVVMRSTDRSEDTLGFIRGLTEPEEGIDGGVVLSSFPSLPSFCWTVDGTYGVHVRFRKSLS